MPNAPEPSPPNPFTARVERCLFARRGLVLAAFALITIIMGWYAAQLRVDAGFFKLVPLKHEYMQTFLKHRDEFGGADRVLIAITAREGDMFTPEFFEVLKQITDAMFFLPGIDRTQVASILTPNVRYIEVVEDGVTSGNVLPADFRPTKEGLARVRENAIKAGIVGRLVANDFTGAIVSGRLQEFHPHTGERLDYIEVARQLEDIRVKGQEDADVDVHVHVIGFAKLVGDVAAGAVRVVAFFGITFLITALFVFLYTRSLRLTIPPLVCSLVAVVWQLGTVTALGFGIDPMSILVPFLVFAVGVSHGVQMVSSVRAEVVAGATGLDAARASVRRLLLPGAVALASDSVGFITISPHRSPGHPGDRHHRQPGHRGHHPHQSGASAGPALVFPHERRAAAGGGRAGQRPAAVVVPGGAARAPGSAAAVTVALAAILVAVGAHYAVQVRVGDSHQGVPELRAESVYNQDIAVITDRFKIGVDVLTVFAETVPDGCIDYEVLTTLDEFAWHVRNVDGRPVRAEPRRRRPQHQRRLERGQPQVAHPAPQPLLPGAIGIPGSHQQRPHQQRLQRAAGAHLHRRPQGRDHPAHRRRHQGIPAP